MWTIFLVGHEEALDEEIDQIKSTFNIKIQTEENYYLGCKFLVSEDKKKDWLGQPHMNKSVEKFGHLSERIQTPNTAGTPGLITIKLEEKEKLDLEGQKIYQSSMGTLLYLLKCSYPDLSNAV